LAAFVASVVLIRRIGRRLGHPRPILAVGLAALVPSILKSLGSLELQMSSSHYQERTHIPAVLTVVGSLGALAILSLFVRRWRAEPRAAPDGRDDR
jgi:uncharacterized membrane protein (UPF0136 family)